MELELKLKGNKLKEQGLNIFDRKAYEIDDPGDFPRYQLWNKCRVAKDKHVSDETGEVSRQVLCSPCSVGLCSYWHCVNCPVRDYLMLEEKYVETIVKRVYDKSYGGKKKDNWNDYTKEEFNWWVGSNSRRNSEKKAQKELIRRKIWEDEYKKAEQVEGKQPLGWKV